MGHETLCGLVGACLHAALGWHCLVSSPMRAGTKIGQGRLGSLGAHQPQRNSRMKCQRWRRGGRLRWPWCLARKPMPLPAPSVQSPLDTDPPPGPRAKRGRPPLSRASPRPAVSRFVFCFKACVWNCFGYLPTYAVAVMICARVALVGCPISDISDSGALLAQIVT